MKTYFNFSLVITSLGVLGISFSETIFGDFLGTPGTDLLILAVTVIGGLLSALVTSNLAIQHSTKKECFIDCVTDVASIMLHLSVSIFWYTYSTSWFPAGFISNLEHWTIFSLLIIMTVLAIFEFLITLNNCLESMHRIGHVKVV